jgi:response regulator of citrate/malate metabolism
MSKQKILIIDDVPEVAEYFALLLNEMQQFTLLASAQNTWDARRLIFKNRPDLILLDELLEGESSYDFAKEVCEVEGIPVIFLTGMENPTHLVSPFALGRVKKPLMDNNLKKTSKNLELELTKLLTKGRINC